MADVTRDRGQLILITGFALAFALVAIVLLLNTVIYTENLASRGLDRSNDEALEFRDAVIEGLGDSMVQTNLDTYDTTSTAQTEFKDTVSNLSQMFSRIHLGEGTFANLSTSTLEMRPGALLQQTNRSRNFTAIDGATEWTLAEDVNATRRARFFVNRNSLELGGLPLDLTGSTPFGVRLVGTTNNWTAYISKTSTGAIVLSTTQDGSSATTHCSVDASNATVVLTGEGIVGEECGGYEWAEGITSNYTIRFLDAADATGSYNLTINTDGATVNASNFNSNPGTDPDPHEYGAVYSATIRIRYKTPTYLYETTLTVAPGAPDE